MESETRQSLRKRCKALGVTYTLNDSVTKLKTKLKNHKMTKETKNGNITQEQIEAWKKQYGKVYIVTVTMPDESTATGYLRKPKRDHKAVALSMYSQNKILESGEFLRDNCWLGGDERLKTDEDAADTAAIQASGIVKFLEAELGEA